MLSETAPRRDGNERPRPDFLEPHYSLAELAEAWHLSGRCMLTWFRHEPGVLRFTGARAGKGHNKRPKVTIRIPESVARRVYRRRTGKALLERGSEV